MAIEIPIVSVNYLQFSNFLINSFESQYKLLADYYFGKLFAKCLQHFFFRRLLSIRFVIYFYCASFLHHHHNNHNFVSVRQVLSFSFSSSFSLLLLFLFNSFSNQNIMATVISPLVPIWCDLFIKVYTQTQTHTYTTVYIYTYISNILWCVGKL